MSENPAQHRLTLIWYGATIFISSAILLVMEITAGRLIAPYVGVTLYSWTSIIGVILAGLSLGNWLGGVWADRGAGQAATGIVLGLSGIFCLFSLLVLSQVAPLLQNSAMDLISASFVYTLAMFFLPSVLLGIPTPLLTTLALKLDDRTGHIVGRMHALAALGSISGTFLTGFVLIQYMGSRMVIIMSALILFVLALPFYRRASTAAAAGLIGVAIIIGLLTHGSQGFSNPCDRESNYFCLRVVDMSEQASYGTARALVLDHLVHGINHQDEPAMLISPYIHLMDELVLQHFDSENLSELSYFFAGGGAYTLPRAVKTVFPDSAVIVAELDPRVTATAQRELFVNTDGMHIVHGDARNTLYRWSGTAFDVIVTDAFHDLALPYHLVTREYIQLVKARLRPDGLFVTNVVDAFPDARLVKSLVKTFSEAFSHVDVWVHEIPQTPQRMTYVISASQLPIDDDLIRAQRGIPRQWLRINEPLTGTGTSMAALPVFTDDFVPVERLISSLLLTGEGR